MKQFFSIAVITALALISCKPSQTELREKAKMGIIDYFHEKYKGVTIDSLNVFKVEVINEGRAAYKAFYEKKTTEAANGGLHISISISPKANDYALLTKDFKVIATRS